MKTLFVRLEGPLQSWGARARFQERDTAPEPTKSAVVGLFACALGWGRDRDADIRALGETIRIGVRVDVPGRYVTDYHTVTGGVLSATGSVKFTASSKRVETVVSHRVYLSDASFLVTVQASLDVVDLLAGALQAPVWPPFLGRRSCPASAPFFAGTGEHQSLEDALESYPRHPRAKPGPIRAVLDASPGLGPIRMDGIQSLATRSYVPRFTTEIVVSPEERR